MRCLDEVAEAAASKGYTCWLWSHGFPVIWSCRVNPTSGSWQGGTSYAQFSID